MSLVKGEKRNAVDISTINQTCGQGWLKPTTQFRSDQIKVAAEIAEIAELKKGVHHTR